MALFTVCWEPEALLTFLIRHVLALSSAACTFQGAGG